MWNVILWQDFTSPPGVTFQKAVYLIHTANGKSNLKILNSDVLALCDCYLLQKTGSQEIST